MKNDTVSGSDIITDEVDVDDIEDMESLTLAEDTLTYIAVTDTCIAFGIFFLIGLILAKTTWGRFK